MKKIIFIAAIAFLAIGAIYAQGRGVPEPVKIDGTLQLHNGQFAVASGNTVYYVPMIGRYIGFIDGLKEGSSASFEGYVFGNQLRPVKMTISGKSYDLVPDRRGNGYAMGRGGYSPSCDRRGPRHTGYGPRNDGYGPGNNGKRGRGRGW